MAELTTDESLAGALLPFLHQMQYTQDLYQANADETDAGRVNRAVGDGMEEVGARLGEITQALAAGTLRIVDEKKLKLELAHAMRAAFVEGLAAKDPTRAFGPEAKHWLDKARARGVLR